MKNFCCYVAVVFVALLSISACQTTKPGYFERTPIATPGNAMLYLYRPAASNPGLAKPLFDSYPEVMIDNVSYGFLRYDEYLALEVPAGQHDVLLTGLTKDARWRPQDVKYIVKLKADSETFMKFRVEFNTNDMNIFERGAAYHINLYPVPAQTAIYEIRDTEKGN